MVRRPQAAVDPESRPLSIVHANLLYINHRVADVPASLATLDADVITFSELTPSHAARLQASALAAEYPYRIELPARHASGTGLWSRYPVTERVTARTKHHTVVADVAAPGGTIQVIVVHTQSPIDHHHQWLSDLDRLGALCVDQPAVMTGDFNAGWWHPEFRRLLRRGGWRDAHIAVGRGLSCSWPTDQWHVAFRWHPPFVRLDHALANDGLADPRRRRLRRARQRPPGLAGHRAASRPSSALNARPRCDMACFSASVISANVRPSPSSGTNTAS